MYRFTILLFLDKLRIKCESLRKIESEMVKLLEFLDRRTTRHLFRSSVLNVFHRALSPVPRETSYIDTYHMNWSERQLEIFFTFGAL